MSTTRCAVRRLIAPNSTRLAFAPVIGTVACVPLRAQAARSGGNNRSNVQSQHSSTSPACQPARRRRIIAPFSGPDVLLFLGQMCCSRGIDIAGPLPAVVHLMQAAAQCPGADRDTMALLQIMPEQWHRPTRGLIAAAARVACEGCRQATRGKLRG